MIEGQSIVCFSSSDWWAHTPQDKTHIMRVLARKNRILYINSIGMMIPSVRKRGFLARLNRKVASFFRGLRMPYRNLYIYTPAALPLYGKPVIEKLNSFFVYLQVQVVLIRLGMRNPLVWTSIPSSYPIIRRIRRSGLIYLYSDKYDSYREVTAQLRIRELDDHLFRLSDVAFCASMLIYKHRSHPEKSYYMPHGVDFHHFHCALTENLPVPEDMKAIPKPDIVIYLHNSPENLYARKQEITMEELTRQVREFKEILPELPNVYRVETDKSLNEVVHEVASIILSFMEQRIKSRVR